jgi:hypothetical protein
MALFANVARAIVGDELASRLDAVAQEPDHPQRLYDAAYALYEEKLHDIAAGLLLRANDLVPGQAGILTELSANLEATLRYDLAADILARSGLLGNEPFCTYLHGFNALMSGDLATARTRMEQIDESTPRFAFMAASLRGLVARADAIGGAMRLDRSELTGWHAAINGTLLLHESPFGFDEGMRGRYAYMSDSAGLMHEGVERLGALLAAAGARPSRVIAAPDRASHILALAAGRMLGLPVVGWSASDAGAGLVCCWDLDKVDDADFRTESGAHAPGRILFAHASRWIDPFPYAPDVTTVLYQQCAGAYTGGAMRVNPETRKVEIAEADPRPDAELAAEIATATPHDPSRRPLDAALSVVRATRELPHDAQIGLRRTHGRRLRQQAGGPVMSSYFT